MDTAEYQLTSLADAMTNSIKAATAAGWRSKEFRNGYEAAMADIAKEMELTTQTAYSYP